MASLSRRAVGVSASALAATAAWRAPAKAATADAISVTIPEVYELANIALAVTPYGRSDPLEVQQGTPYHQRVMSHFARFAEHPLIAKINYSRERWQDYLSFRSDSYAFRFRRNGRIERAFAFAANDGFDPFTQNLADVEDFARISGFRAFFRNNRRSYRALERAYGRSYFIVESRAFLEREFGAEFSGEYRVVISPLVGRMNAQRALPGGVQLGFVTVAAGLLRSEGRAELPIRERLEEFHTLLTEMDHAYVNPVTASRSETVNVSFDHRLWTRESGYDNSEAAFNEYMTWALYDVMLEDLGVDDDLLISNWHLVNKSRGFRFSEVFARKVVELRREAGRRGRVRDLYPGLLRWCAAQQAQLTLPEVVSPTQPIARASAGATQVVLRFSEPMRADTRLEAIPSRMVAGERQAEAKISIEGVAWSEDQREVRFAYALPEGAERRLTFNAWDTSPITSQAGVYANRIRVNFRD